MANTHLSLRVSAHVAAALAERAERAGCTVSDLVRQAVDEQLAGDAPAEAGRPDPFSKLAVAARGGLQAQRDLANEAIRLASEDNGLDPYLCLRDGLIFARLAAAHGRVEDQGLVIAMVALMVGEVGEENCADEMAEALARLSLAADQDGEGGELAATYLETMVSASSSDVVEGAKVYRKRIAGERG